MPLKTAVSSIPMLNSSEKGPQISEICTLIPNWIPIARREPALRITAYMLTGGAVINVTGNTYINDYIATGTHEGYDNEYEIDTKGNVNTISKNDAVSAKHGDGSTVNINANEDGTILNPNNTVQIYGNLDAKKRNYPRRLFW